MIDRTIINTLLGIKESYEMPSRLLEILQDKEKREALFNNFCEYIDDFSVDVLRDYFQNEHGDKKELKQDYTPDCICKLINELSGNSRGSIRDICAGSGALTISKINTGQKNIFYCDEVSTRVLPVLLLNLAIRNANAYVRQMDILTNKAAACYKLTAEEKYSNIEKIDNIELPKIDTVISNPPYSLKFDNAEEFADDERFKDYGLPPKSRADFAFILDGLSCLDENGEAYFIMPSGVLFRGQKEEIIRKKLIENNLIDAVIELPEKLFLTVSISVFILILKKNRQNKDVLFINAEKEFKKVGKMNELTAEHIEKIVMVYKNRLACEKFSRRVSYEEIKKNNFNLSMPRYVDTSEEPEKINLIETINDIEQLTIQANNTREELIKMMGELVGDEEFNTGFDMIKSLHDYEMKTLEQIGVVEQAKANKLYEKGTIIFYLSGISSSNPHLMDFCKKPTKIERSACAVKPFDEYNAYYIYTSIQNVYDEFINKYRTTINLQFDTLVQYLQFPVHKSRLTQDNIANQIRLKDLEIEIEQAQLGQVKKMKNYFLDNMFA